MHRLKRPYCCTHLVAFLFVAITFHFRGQVAGQDACSTTICQNSGTCQVGSDGEATCACASGFSGLRCQRDACSTTNCQNGGTCQVGSDGEASCACAFGFRGRRCQRGPTQCRARLCRNGGTCTNDGGDFVCTCALGYRGRRCSIAIDNCAVSPCKNEARCVDGLNDFTCECRRGFSGETCEIAVDECLGDPCENGGVCEDLVGGFFCRCTDEYEGDKCQTRKDCSPNPCQNGGACEGVADGYVCRCSQGYSGQRCGTAANSCSPNPCENQGECQVEDPPTTFTCSCISGYAGDRCQIDINECLSTPCMKGVCVDGRNSYTCNCVPGYTGLNCESNIDDCTPSSCANGGTCLDGENTFTCNCPPGFTGTTCEGDIDDCPPGRCRNGGTCEDLVVGFNCNCALGYTGQTCEQNIYNCYHNPCLNGADCEDLVDDYRCSCRPGFTGKDCDIDIDDCDPNPCLNQGVCTDRLNGFRCQCRPGFLGDRCDGDIDDCDPNLCQNGGLCVDLMSGFDCRCANGYEGSTCTQNIDDCSPNPCANGGLCEDLVDDFDCTCPAGFNGPTCAGDIDECAGKPCNNGGTCVDGTDSFTCVCPVGYGGTTCQTAIDFCASGPCRNGGQCMKLLAAYRCLCGAAFTGSTCESRVECSSIQTHARRDCGQSGITRITCEQKGCCYDNSVKNVLWCFHKELQTNPCLAVDPAERIDCGQKSISKEDCASRGCCFDNTRGGVPWCFFENSDPSQRQVTGVPFPTATPPTIDGSVISTTAIPEEDCQVLLTARIDCGFSGIRPSECIARSCCYGSGPDKVPWCYKRASGDRSPPPEFECQRTTPVERKDCGYGGISEDACRRRGCCYDKKFSKLPWCFHNDGRDSPPNGLDCARDIPTGQRVNCGHPGIKREVCKDYGCCFNNTVFGVPWCYKRQLPQASTAMPGPDGATTATPGGPSSTQCGEVPKDERLSCGAASASRIQCNDGGCCYDDSTSGAPLCFDKYRRTTDNDGPACDPPPTGMCHPDLIFDGNTCQQASRILVQLTFNLNYDETDRAVIVQRVTDGMEKTLCKRIHSVKAITLNKRVNDMTVAEVELSALLPLSGLEAWLREEFTRRGDRFATFPVQPDSLRLIQKPTGASCSAGSYYSVIIQACAVCPRDHFQPEGTERLCTVCAKGSATATTGTIGSRGCLSPCPAGQEFDGAGCLRCDYGTYKPAAGSGACLQCPRAQTTGQRGSTSISQCTDTCFSLPAGYCGAGGVCKWDSSDRGTFCVCNVGYTGSRCQVLTTAVSSLEPAFGPVSGTTVLTISGANLNSTDEPTVFLRTIPCIIHFSLNTMIQCVTSRLIDTTLLRERLSLVIKWKKTGRTITFDQRFEYREDPIIENVEPSSGIVSGGTNLTVTGQFLDSALIFLQITTDFDSKKSVFDEPCELQESTKLLCPTPALDLPLGLRALVDAANINVKPRTKRDVTNYYGDEIDQVDAVVLTDADVKRRVRRQTNVNQPINEATEAKFSIGFMIDGLTKYLEFSKNSNFDFDVYGDPVLDKETDRVLIYRPFWPFNDAFIEIKGKGLLSGVRRNEYRVKIGDVYCEKLDVISNVIFCTPPTRQPAVTNTELGDAPDMKVEVGIFLQYEVGFVDYEHNLWEHTPARIGIISGVVAVVVICAIVFFIMRYRHKRKAEKDLELYFPQHFQRRSDYTKWTLDSRNTTLSAYPFGQVARRMFNGMPDATRRSSRGSMHTTYRSNSSSSSYEMSGL